MGYTLNTPKMTTIGKIYRYGLTDHLANDPLLNSFPPSQTIDRLRNMQYPLIKLVIHKELP
jgi:hypothetical protein